LPNIHLNNPFYDKDKIERIFIDCCHAVYQNDRFLIENNVREEAVSHRLAVYLERAFLGFDVDCEYNKAEDLPKKLLTEPDFSCNKMLDESQQRAARQSWVRSNSSKNGNGLRPDIIVHQRGRSAVSDNLLVAECKKGRTGQLENSNEYHWALIRLNEFTSGRQLFIYQHGALAVFQPQRRPYGLFFSHGGQMERWAL
jgi:hypothetical protein